ncbi:hypothetical protein BT96DRAFT_914225 [Gymnopus androsaceus JB14]|uniref:Uncharacterized protein n=1 Tax=Gymnopus androsaceus JB14 TaxID=1447944 RepID=A0A6A4I748_9AGAR|nr:hypothetical protein BT96DRAFT_914225 [Gymnopus androsaceus JB14]
MTRFFTPQMHSILLKSNYFFNKLQSNVGFGDVNNSHDMPESYSRLRLSLHTSFFRHWREE